MQFMEFIYSWCLCEREREREEKQINTTLEIMILSVVWGGGGNRKLNKKSV
jgi:hypothetical protein